MAQALLAHGHLHRSMSEERRHDAYYVFEAHAYKSLFLGCWMDFAEFRKYGHTDTTLAILVAAQWYAASGGCHMGSGLV